MSIVEQALRKHKQERVDSRDQTSASQGPSVWSEAKPAQEMDVDGSVSPRSDIKVDLSVERLRKQDLYPPVDFERRIVNQFRNIKRPLVKRMRDAASSKPNEHVIMMTSSVAGEGKTFSSMMLALSFALEKETEVVLIDTDAGRPRLTKALGLQSESGLIDALQNDSANPESLLIPTSLENFFVLPVGRSTEVATELYASERMTRVLGRLSAKKERVLLLDCAPVLQTVEARVLAQVAGQIVLVVKAKSTPQRHVLQTLEQLAGNAFVGLVLNESEEDNLSSYYGYSDPVAA